MLYSGTMFGLNLRQVFLLTVSVVGIFVAAQFIPIFFHSYQFSDSVQQSVKFAVSGRKTMDKIRQEIMEAAVEDAIPITVRDIHITRHGPAFTVEIDYHLTANLRVYQYQKYFHVTASGEMFGQ